VRYTFNHFELHGKKDLPVCLAWRSTLLFCCCFEFVLTRNSSHLLEVLEVHFLVPSLQ